MNLEELEQFVLAEIETYRSVVSDGALGRAFTDEKVERVIVEMRAALVRPEWRTVDRFDPTAAGGQGEPRRCALVADDGTYQLFYDPIEDELGLANGDPPAMIGVDGDAVGCWMAR